MMTLIFERRTCVTVCACWAVLALSIARIETAAGGLMDVGVAECPPGSNIIEGTSGPDVLTGTAGRDCILGYGGNDQIDGAGDADVIAGGPGDDTLRGGHGSDVIYGENGSDTIDGQEGADTIDGGDGDDLLDGGNGSDAIVGGAGNDIINGGNGADTIDGGVGNDIIRDSLGGDSISGGEGIDACSSGCEEPTPVACSTSSECGAGQSCVGGSCVYCRANSECTDGLVCNGAEACVPATGCQAGPVLPFGFDLGISCSAGIGACAANGGMVCNGAGGSVCGAVPGTPTPEVCNGIDDDCDGVVDDGAPDADGDGTCDSLDMCAFHPDLTHLPGDVVTGMVFCESPDDDAGPIDFPLTSFPVRTSAGTTMTDCTGRYTYVVPTGSALGEGAFNVNFFYDGAIPGPAGSATRLRVMDDVHVAYGTRPLFEFGITSTAALSVDASGRRTLNVAPITIRTSECEIWRIGTNVVNDYQQVRQRSTQSGTLEFMRRAAVFGTTPYAPYDYVDLPADFLDVRPVRDRRERTLYHESAHVARDIADGDGVHWFGDAFAYRYARCHTGTEITEEPYAFHEGWAQYWAQARIRGRAPLAPAGTRTAYCGLENGPDGVLLGEGHRDWVENMVADRLLELAQCVAGSATDFDAADNLMLATLEANPGTIHSLFEFERALCTLGGCCAGTRTEPPPPCPPGYTTELETCRAADTTFIWRYR